MAEAELGVQAEEMARVIDPEAFAWHDAQLAGGVPAPPWSERMDEALRQAYAALLPVPKGRRP